MVRFPPPLPLRLIDDVSHSFSSSPIFFSAVNLRLQSDRQVPASFATPPLVSLEVRGFIVFQIGSPRQLTCPPFFFSISSRVLFS